MYFDFEDNRPEVPTYTRAISTREGVLMSIIFHLLVVIGVLVAPELPFVKEAEARRQAELEELQRQEMERTREQARFVFIQPRVEPPPSRPPERAELSDVDRRARTMERAPDARNPLPFSRGNSAERIVGEPEPRPAGPAAPEPAASAERAEAAPPVTAADSPNGFRRRAEAAEPQEPRPTGILADAIRNVQRYAPRENFANPQGGQEGEFGPFISFDSKGVEFGPWIARFVAQVRRNWFIPMAAMTMRGHVVVTFFVHKDGRITDVSVLKPSSVEAFTLSARNAILASNPTVPLPPEYPDDRAFFTVTFFFNESPP